jgi:hypothetical protein
MSADGPILDTGPDPVNDCVGHRVAAGEFVETGERCLAEPDPGDGLLMAPRGHAGVALSSDTS